MTDSNIRTMTRGLYDIQKLRIMAGNRVVANFKAKLGQAPSESEDELSDDAKALVAALRAAYRRIADAGASLTKIAKNGTGDELISDLTEYALVANYDRLVSAEEDHFAALKKIVEQQPIWREFLDGVKGCGPAMGAVLISEIDISKARYASSIWKYAGLDLGPDGRGRTKQKTHLVKRTYKTAKGEIAERDSVTYNPFLKTKLMGVLAPAFLKANSPYREHYDRYKHRQESLPEDVRPKTKLHIHNRSMRYMVKMFLIDFYVASRTLHGLPVSLTYHEGKLGHVHGRAA